MDNPMSSGNNNAGLMVGALRHQRDLFTGSTLGIPDVNTHVGSVIHAFETMAIERNLKQATENVIQRRIQPISNQSTATTSGGSSAGKKRRAPNPKSNVYPVYSSTQTQETLLEPLHVANQREYLMERSVDETGESSSNVDGASYIIDDNFHKSVFESQPNQQSTNTNTISNANYSRIPIIINTSNANKIDNKNHDTRNITVQSMTTANNKRNINHSKSHIRPISQTTDSMHFIKKFNNSDRHNSSAAVEESCENYEQDFIRGSTVSQSFIKNVKNTGNRKTTYEKNSLHINRSTSIGEFRPRGTPMSSVNRNERKIKAKSTSDELTERYTKHTGIENTPRTRTRSNERRMPYAPNSSDRAEL